MKIGYGDKIMMEVMQKQFKHTINQLNKQYNKKRGI